MIRNGQHVCIKLIFGGLYPYKEIVQEVLAPTDGQSKRILDLGTPFWSRIQPIDTL